MTARTLMVQGTTSDAGKSLLVTALCRWLARRGLSVAPFKPQNMALNSAVTPDGGEIGRAQAVQAAACGLAPTTDMNPVLLKPNSDTGAQVIVHGRAVANLGAVAYHGYKRVALAAVLASHARLAAAYEAVIVEGAGSPAEINLRDNDIANMGFAEAVDCPVILVADIDRGGVFAHIVGTLALLSDTERARIKGFVINRFRGDIALLRPGLDWLERETGKPVLGVLPLLHDLHLDAEDAIVAHQPEKPADALRVVVPVVPRISNHTDFDALRLHPRVDLRFVALGQEPPPGSQAQLRTPSPCPSPHGRGDDVALSEPRIPPLSHGERVALKAPGEGVQGPLLGRGSVDELPADLIILPGSKSVRDDLAALRGAGWEARLLRHLRYGGKVLGICGGMQMLGRAIHDPHGVEGPPGSSTGFGLLDFETTLAPEKTLRNASGRLAWCDAEVRGYEIHAGVTEGAGLARPALLLDGRPDGAVSADGQIMAAYLHGLFDAPGACDALLAWAGAGAGQGGAVDLAARREADFDRLADAVEAHLDTGHLARLLGMAS